MSTNQVKCKNCEKPFDDHFKFCPHCGQKVNDQLTLGVLFYNTINNYFSVDARIFKSFIPLMFKPGFLAKEFIKGKRSLYMHPAQMYLFVTIVFFALFSFTASNQRDMVNNELKKTLKSSRAIISDSIKANERIIIKRVKDSIENSSIRTALENNKKYTGMTDNQIDSIFSQDDLLKPKLDFGFNEKELDSLIEADASEKEIYKTMGLDENPGWFKAKLYSQVLKFYKARDGGNILKTFYDTLPIALFFLLPIFAFILKLLFFLKGRYSHHLVFSLYYFSYLFMVFSIILGINLIWDIPDFIDWLIVLSTNLYLFLALRNFYKQGWFLSFLKNGIVTFTFMSIVIPTAIVFIGFIAFLFY
ncbi:DUF3667 domain-containing protein [Winogradskyella undariae]|uniref:DUF3667 domain-containing protein n=1 Tax=Winogradskyella undariae TaxID=1285465 RepID=UPI0015CC48B3|nr:DUF3667 domain-containing protein [Winogradskyella undariae]